MDKQSTVISNLFLRRGRGTPSTQVNKLQCIKNLGVKHDSNFSFFHSCQVLIASDTIIQQHNYRAGMLEESITLSDDIVSNIQSGAIFFIGKVRLIATILNWPCNVISPSIKRNRGIHCRVISSGTISVGDSIYMNPTQHSLHPDRYSLFRQHIRNIPSGKIVSYREIIDMIGGTTAYYRVIPNFIKRAKVEYPQLPLHRIVNSRFQTLNYIPNQEVLLRKEGVDVTKSKYLSKSLWSPDPQKDDGGWL